MKLTVEANTDLGITDWARPCPICGGDMNLFSRKNMFGEDTNFLRCKNVSCVFGDTKTITWIKSLEKLFNNRSVDFGRCIAKECNDLVVVRASHLCDFHEKEYL